MTKSIYFALLLLFLASFTSCKKDRTITGFDAELFEKSTKSSGYTYYNFNNAYLVSSKSAGHRANYMRLKFNDIAAAGLDEFGVIVSNSHFPEGSMLINEMSSTNTGEPEKYAVMLKDPKNENADEYGWVWSYFNATKQIIESATRKGFNCIQCHSSNTNNDFSVMNTFHTPPKKP